MTTEAGEQGGPLFVGLPGERRTIGSVRPEAAGADEMGVSLIWISANRDEQVFENPEDVRLDRDPESNLLYGAGIHVCPGAPLARLEMTVAMEELLRGSRRIELSRDPLARRAVHPASGWTSVPLRVTSA